MALPNSNISVSMVKAELGAATNDVGRLCTHPNINKWSRYKPIRYPGPSIVLTEDILKDARGGLFMQRVNYIRWIMYDYANNGDIWDYDRPTGGLYPYRLGDFSKYSHTAAKFYDVKAPSIVHQSTSPRVQTSLIITNDPYALNFEMLGMYNYYHIAAIAPVDNPDDFSYAVSDFPITNKTESILTVPINSPVVGTKYVIGHFLCETKTIVDGTSTFYMLEGGSKTFDYLDVGFIVELSGIKIGTGQIHWTLKLINPTNETKIVRNVVVSLRYGDKTPGSTLEDGEQMNQLYDMMIDPGSYTGMFNIPSNALPNIATRGGYLHFTNTTDERLNTTENIILKP